MNKAKKIASQTHFTFTYKQYVTAFPKQKTELYKTAMKLANSKSFEGFKNM